MYMIWNIIIQRSSTTRCLAQLCLVTCGGLVTTICIRYICHFALSAVPSAAAVWGVRAAHLGPPSDPRMALLGTALRRCTVRCSLAPNFTKGDERQFTRAARRRQAAQSARVELLYVVA